MGQYPCKGCTTRHNLCWDSCEDYQKAKKAHEDVKRLKQKDNDIVDYVNQRSERIRKDLRRRPKRYS